MNLVFTPDGGYHYLHMWQCTSTDRPIDKTTQEKNLDTGFFATECENGHCDEGIISSSLSTGHSTHTQIGKEVHFLEYRASPTLNQVQRGASAGRASQLHQDLSYAGDALPLSAGLFTWTVTGAATAVRSHCTVLAMLLSW